MQTAPKVEPATLVKPDVPILIDTEKGHRSVSGFIKRGELRLVEARSFKAVEKVIWEIESAPIKPRGIILDTITNFAATTILDVTKETPRGQIWENRTSLQSTQQQWGIMGGIIIRLLRVARSFGIPVYLTSHEGERYDEAAGISRHFPDLNNMLLKDVVQNADAVLRVYRSSAMFEADGKRYNAGTLAVRVMPNEQFYAKIRVPDDLPVPPAVLGNSSPNDWKPVVKRLYELTGGLESVVIYGAPGVGKTRLAAELATYVS